MAETEVQKNEFTKLYELHQTQLKSFIYRLVTNKQDAEDLGQETFIKAYKKLATFKGNSSFKTWLFSIATNTVKDFHKAQKRWSRDAQDNCSQSVKNSLSLQEKVMKEYNSGIFEIKNHIDYCFTCVMKYLPIERHIAIMLADIYEFKVFEIAHILGKSVGSIKHLLFSGRKSMKQIFAEDCTLINKTGACWKCSELSNSKNSKAITAKKILELEIAQKQNESRQKLYKLRTALVKGIDPLNSSSFSLHNFLLQHTDFAQDKTFKRIEKECGE